MDGSFLFRQVFKKSLSRECNGSSYNEILILTAKNIHRGINIPPHRFLGIERYRVDIHKKATNKDSETY